MMDVAQMGSMRTTCFTSSTSVRVHSIHLLASAGDSPAARSMMAAWSRNLHKNNTYYMFLLIKYELQTLSVPIWIANM
jgi:hypothetical protein